MAQDNKLIRSLIESSRNGNNNAFGQLIKIHIGYVFAISIRLLADFEDACENTSKTFIEAWKTISMVRRDYPFILLLKAIAIYSSLQRIREKGNDKKDSNDQKPNRKGLDFLDQEIISLPETERLVFVLNDIEHYQKEEISDLLSMTKEETENFLANARKIIMKAPFIGSNEALEISLKQIPESLEPSENLYDRIISDLLKTISPVEKKEPELAQDINNKSIDKKSEQEKKRFSFKDLFKKKE